MNLHLGPIFFMLKILKIIRRPTWKKFQLTLDRSIKARNCFYEPELLSPYDLLANKGDSWVVNWRNSDLNAELNSIFAPHNESQLFHWT